MQEKNFFSHLFCGLIACLAIFSAHNVQAAPVVRALLIGVSDYPVASVGTELQLDGPKYDVALMVDALKVAGVDDRAITILADGFDKTWIKRPADGLPTKKAIMDAFARLAGEAKPGDVVLIYMSGHGSQEPEVSPAASKNPEADGLNETFLPLDIGKWNDTVGLVENSLVDDELGVAVQAIRAKGAFVWLVVDACHSGTLTRSGGVNTDDVTKKVEPSVLGVPKAALDRARAAALANRPATRSAGGGAPVPDQDALINPTARAGDGGYVAFYAAHPDELALQRALPRGYEDIENKRPHGVLTFYMVQALRSGGMSSYRQLAFRIMAGYEQIGSDAPVPLFEGELDAGLFGGRGGPKGLYQVTRAVSAISIAAGAVDGITPQTVFALAVVGQEKEPFAYVQADKITLSETSASFTAFGGAPAAIESMWPSDGVVVASIAARGVPLALRVARPQEPRSEAERAIQSALNALGHPSGPAAPGLALTLLPLGTRDVDLALKFEDNALWFVPDNGAFSKSGRDKTPSLDLGVILDDSVAQRVLVDRLGRVAKARNLLRATSQLLGSAVESKLAVKAYLWRPNLEPLPTTARAPDDRRCPDLPRDIIPEGALAFDDIAPGGLDAIELTHCDRIYFRLTNTGDKPIDVTPLYVDGGSGIGYLGPYDGLRLLPNEQPRVIGMNIVTYSVRSGNPLPTGLERMIFIAVQRPDRAALPADFSYLAQPSLGATTRSAGATSALQNLLNDAAFGGVATRSASAPTGAEASEAGAFTFQWRVKPPQPAQ